MFKSSQSKMSLLKWQRLAKRKSDLGQNINVVHDSFLKHDLGKKIIIQEALSKVFKPVTDKLNVVTLPRRVAQVPDYDDHVEAVPDYALDELYAEPEPDPIDFAKTDPRMGPKPGQRQDDKLFAYLGIPSYDELEEDLKGMSREEAISHISEVQVVLKAVLNDSQIQLNKKKT